MCFSGKDFLFFRAGRRVKGCASGRMMERLCGGRKNGLGRWRYCEGGFSFRGMRGIFHSCVIDGFILEFSARFSADCWNLLLNSLVAGFGIIYFLLCNNCSAILR